MKICNLTVLLRISSDLTIKLLYIIIYNIMRKKYIIRRVPSKFRTHVPNEVDQDKYNNVKYIPSIYAYSIPIEYI